MEKIAHLFTNDHDDFYGYCDHCIVIPVPEDAKYCADCADEICEYLAQTVEA